MGDKPIFRFEAKDAKIGYMVDGVFVEWSLEPVSVIEFKDGDTSAIQKPINLIEFGTSLKFSFKTEDVPFELKLLLWWGIQPPFWKLDEALQRRRDSRRFAMGIDE